jgi:hypothetical protein
LLRVVLLLECGSVLLILMLMLMLLLLLLLLLLLRRSVVIIVWLLSRLSAHCNRRWVRCAKDLEVDLAHCAD